MEEVVKEGSKRKAGGTKREDDQKAEKIKVVKQKEEKQEDK